MVSATVAAMNTSLLRPRVLVAEDDDALRDVLVGVLRDDGCEVVQVADGRELFWIVERARRSRPFEVVLSDIRMPGYDGLDVVAAWDACGTLPKVVLMTAFPDPATRRRANDMGVVLLEKPFSLGLLEALVRELGDKASRAH